jgi:membrane protein
MTAHGTPDRAAQAAFYMLLSVLPGIMVLLGMLALLDLADEIARFAQLMEDTLPQAVSEPLLHEMTRLTDIDPLRRMVLGLVLSLYSASRGVAAVLSGIGDAWGEGGLVNRLAARGLGAVVTLAVILVTLVLVVLLSLGEWLLGWFVDHHLLSEQIAVFISLGRWPLIFLVLQQLINTLYQTGARRRSGWHWITWGSAFATVGWIVSTVGFGIYVEQVVDLGATYGSLGTVIGLLLYFYVAVLNVMLGSELDALLRRERQRRTTQ